VGGRGTEEERAAREGEIEKGGAGSLSSRPDGRRRRASLRASGDDGSSTELLHCSRKTTTRGGGLGLCWAAPCCMRATNKGKERGNGPKSAQGRKREENSFFFYFLVLNNFGY
jgi:hypothetical protein